MQNRSIKALISGKVQGVWYRDSTRQQANKLAITGYAKNLSDGSVEVMAEGADGSIALLLEWLKEGPPNAIVKDVIVEEVAQSNAKDFSIL